MRSDIFKVYRDLSTSLKSWNDSNCWSSDGCVGLLLLEPTVEMLKLNKKLAFNYNSTNKTLPFCS